MQELGNYLELLGPVFGVVFLFMTAAVGVVLIGIGGARLLQRDHIVYV